jgi:hypothetical protein
LHRAHEWEVAINGVYEGVQYRLMAADYIEMKPQLVWTVADEAVAGKVVASKSVETEGKG